MAKDCINLVQKILRNNFDLVVSDLMFLASQNELETFLESKTDTDRKKLEDEYLLFSRKKRIYDQIRFLDANGMEKVRVDYKNGNAAVVDESNLQNKSKRYYFKDTFLLEKNEVFISPFDLNIEHGSVEMPFKPMLRFGTPIVNDRGEKAGCVIVNFLAQTLIDDIKHISSRFIGTTILLNSQGYWLIGPDKDIEWGFMFEEKKNISFAAKHPLFWKTIENSDSGQFFMPGGRIYTFTSVYPLSEGWKSSTGASTPFGPSAKAINAGEYYWKIVNSFPSTSFKSSMIKFFMMFFKKFYIYFIIIAFACLFYARILFRHKITEAELSKLSLAVKQSPVSIAITNIDGIIEYVNPKFTELTGYTSKEAIGRNLNILNSGKNPPSLYKNLWKTIMSGREWRGEFYNKKKDGRYFWEYASITAIRDKKGKITHFLGIKEDVTERKKNEQELKRLASFPEDNPNIVIELDLDCNITYLNPTCKRKFPNIRGACINHPLVKDIVTNPMEFKDMRGKSDHGELTVGDSIFERKIRYIPGSQIIRVYAFDVTKRKKIEKDLENAINEAKNASRLKSVFLANMSHEIRTPMNAIIGFSDMLLADETDAIKRERLKIITKSGKVLLVLIDDILDFSKIEANKLKLAEEEFSIQETIDHLNNMFRIKAEEKNLAFIIKSNDYIPDSVTGDVHRVKQILMNLLTNAFKFTSQGNVTLEYFWKEGIMTFKVIDTGIGIPLEKQKAIFSPFHQADLTTTRKYGGAGLGLTITRRLIEMMNGMIAIDENRRDNNGATFIVTIPLPAVLNKDEQTEISSNCTEPAMIRSNSMSNEKKEGDLTGIKVLLVEDDEFNRLLAKALLEQEGIEVSMAENGRKALDKLAVNCYDLVLLDMNMPVMNGVETIEKIRNNDDLSSLYVIALTANAIDGDKDIYIDAGCDDYLPKPLEVNMLYEKIRNAFTVKKQVEPTVQYDNTIRKNMTENDNRDLGRDKLDREEIDKKDTGEDALLPESIEILKESIQGLKENRKIFVPAKIENVANRLTKVPGMKEIKKDLLHAAGTFNDEMLDPIIKKLEESI